MTPGCQNKSFTSHSRKDIEKAELKRTDSRTFLKMTKEIYGYQQLRIQSNGQESLQIRCQRQNNNIRIENIKQTRVKENTLKRTTTTKA